MDTKKQLTIGMSLLFIFVISFFGIIIINIKNKELLLPKVEKKMDSYIKNKYIDISNNININKAKYNNSKNQYEIKVSSKDNNNLYFMVYYKNNKFSNTYKNDYIKGNSLLNYYKKSFLKKLPKSKKYINTEISFTKSLNNYSSIVKKALIDNDNIAELSIYSIKSDTIVPNFNNDSLINYINNYYKYINNSNLKPKYYNLILTNKDDITKSLEINNLNEELIINNLEEIVTSIVNNDKTITKKYDFNYKYSD